MFFQSVNVSYTEEQMAQEPRCFLVCILKYTKHLNAKCFSLLENASDFIFHLEKLSEVGHKVIRFLMVLSHLIV